MKLDAKIIDMHYDFGLKGTTITLLSFGNLTPNLEEYLNKDLSVDIKKRRQKK